MMARISGVFSISVLVWCIGVPAAAQDVAQEISHGQINWTDKTITVTGSGAPGLKAPNVAVARLNAEGAAKLDALRNILEAVKGVRVTGTTTAGEAMSGSNSVGTRVEGIVKNYKVLDTKYYSDGGVDVIVQVNLDGVLTQALVPGSGKATEPSAANDDVTGIIVNAKGLSVAPAIAPEIKDESGKKLYHAGSVAQAAMMKHGAVSYNQSLSRAMKDARVGSKPLVVRALKADAPGGSNLVVSSADAAGFAKASAALSAGKVIIVTD